MRRLLAMVENVARADVTVLLRGESGTGKELFARLLHEASHRASGPFLAVNCAAVAPSLLESELFGHEKGAFTGALATHQGYFERADSGTLFLDEVAELPLDVQAKLLRVLEQRTFFRVGGKKAVSVDVRVVSATHTSLREAVKAGRFREDLMYRLRVVPVFLPPLRDRRVDIPVLVDHFVSRLNDAAKARGGRTVERVEPEAMRALLGWRFPGNVRELKNTIERAAYLASGGVIEPSDLHIGRRQAPAPPLPAPLAPTGAADGPALQPSTELAPELAPQPFKEAKQAVIDAFERAYFARLLARCDNNLSHAAAEAGITRYYLRELLKRHGLHRGKDDDP